MELTHWMEQQRGVKLRLEAPTLSCCRPTPGRSTADPERHTEGTLKYCWIRASRKLNQGYQQVGRHTRGIWLGVVVQTLQ